MGGLSLSSVCRGSRGAAVLSWPSFLASDAELVDQERSSLMCMQEFGAAHSLHSSTVDGQQGVRWVASPEVNDDLLGLIHLRWRLLSLHHVARWLTSFL